MLTTEETDEEDKDKEIPGSLLSCHGKVSTANLLQITRYAAEARQQNC